MASPAVSGITVPARRRGYRATAGILLIVMLGGTLPVPLYVLYERQMGFGSLGVTMVFAGYVVGTLSLALIALGELSDHIGRRKVLALAVAGAAASTALFLIASDYLAAGGRPGDQRHGRGPGYRHGDGRPGQLQPRDHRAAAVVASGSNMTGLGLGPLVACSPSTWPCCHSVFWAYLGVCAVALAALWLIPETVRDPDGAVSFRPRLAAPPGVRVALIGAGLGVFAAFSVLGQFSSVVPTFLHGILGVHNFALIGAAAFLIFVTAAVSQAVSARLPSRRSLLAGLPLLLVCLAALESALFARLLWLFLAGTVTGGVAVGFIFRGGLSELNRLAEPEHRAAVVSAFFVAAYLGLGLPAVVTGLISLQVGAVDASTYVAVLSATAVAVAFVVVLRSFGTVAAPGPPPVPCDSWRSPREPARASAT